MRRMRRDVNLASWLAGWWPASPAGWLAGTGWLAGWLAGLAGWRWMPRHVISLAGWLAG